jgi:hypothetical protein
MRNSHAGEPSCLCNLSNPSAVQVVYLKQYSGSWRLPADFSAIKTLLHQLSFSFVYPTILNSADVIREAEHATQTVLPELVNTCCVFSSYGLTTMIMVKGLLVSEKCIASIFSVEG